MISNSDNKLKGQEPTPEIEPNSQYDQTIAFSGSDSQSEEDPYAGQSPLGETSDDGFGQGRPSAPSGPGDRLNNFRIGGGFDGGLGLDSPSPKGGLGGFSGDSPVGLGGFGSSGFGNIPGGFGEFSPRPASNDATTSNPELAQIFGLITSFQPEPIQIPPHFKPFLPDLIPAIGAIDAFIKVPRPDDEEEPLGLTILDEPTIGCSDPQIIRMQLREKYGIVSAQEGDGYIGEIEDLENNQKALDTFLENYEEMIRDRPPPTIVYSYKMPDLNDLLDVWPEELEKALESIPLPSADMDLTIEEYAKIICAFLDIPVKGNIIESLHVFFTLYMTFEENQHFPDNMSARNSVNLQNVLKLD